MHSSNAFALPPTPASGVTMNEPLGSELMPLRSAVEHVQASPALVHYLQALLAEAE